MIDTRVCATFESSRRELEDTPFTMSVSVWNVCGTQACLTVSGGGWMMDRRMRTLSVESIEWARGKRGVRQLLVTGAEPAMVLKTSHLWYK
jgi:hypothetical protein